MGTLSIVLTEKKHLDFALHVLTVALKLLVNLGIA